MSNTKEIIEALREYKFDLSWKPNNKFGDKYMCVAYIDARDIMNALDAIVGAENWQSRHIGQVGKLFCELSLKLDGEWITKSDAGMDTAIASDKGASSDALKRAAVNWGLGRYIYEWPSVLMPMANVKGKEIPVDSQGKPLYGDNLSKYINTHLDKLQKI